MGAGNSPHAGYRTHAITVTTAASICPREHEAGLYSRITMHLLVDIHPPDARLSILFAEGPW